MQQRTFTYTYNDQCIEYTIWVTSGDTDIETIIFLGTVQIGKLARWVAETCPPKTAIVQGAPHWFAKSDGSDIPDYINLFTLDAFKNITAQYTYRSLSVIADSQAVPGVLRLFAHQASLLSRVRSLTLLQPLGLTARAYAGSDVRRLTLFKKRVVRNFLRQLTELLVDSRLRFNYRLIVKLTAFRSSAALAQYNSGLKHDALPDLQKVASVTNVAIISGEKDAIFPYTEIKASLRHAGIDIPIISIKGVPHSPLATKKGRQLLLAAFSTTTRM